MKHSISLGAISLPLGVSLALHALVVAACNKLLHVRWRPFNPTSAKLGAMSTECMRLKCKPSRCLF